MLPKHIYFYWGNEKMSFLRYMTFKSFRHHNPDWEMTLVKRREPLPRRDYGWTEKQDFMFEQEEDYSDRLEELDVYIEYIEDSFPNIAELDLSDVHTSDILAWYILAYRGGVVSDTDIVFTKPFDWERYKDVQFGICSFEKLPAPDYMPVSFMISQRNEIHELIYETAVERYDIGSYESAGTPAILEAVGNFENIKKLFPEYNVVRLPSTLVFNFAEKFRFTYYSIMLFSQNHYNNLDEDTIGLHWYAGENQRYNRLYKESNIASFNSTVAEAVKAAL